MPSPDVSSAVAGTVLVQHSGPLLCPRGTAGSTQGPAPPVGTHSPQQPFLRPECLPAAPDTGRPRGFLVRPMAGRVSLFHSGLSSSKPMLTAHQPYSAESAGPRSLVINEVFCQPVCLFSRAHPSAGPESGWGPVIRPVS